MGLWTFLGALQSVAIDHDLGLGVSKFSGLPSVFMRR